MRFLDALALEIKLLRGGSAATAARFAQARAAIGAMPARRQNIGMSKRLKRAETYLAKRGKRGGRRAMANKAEPFAPRGFRRPKTLADARKWNKYLVANAQVANASDRLRAPEADIPAHLRDQALAGHQRDLRRAKRASQRMQIANRIVDEWERTKRPPKGFRRGR